MTEFSFDLFITPVPTKFISKFSISKNHAVLVCYAFGKRVSMNTEFSHL